MCVGGFLTRACAYARVCAPGRAWARACKGARKRSETPIFAACLFPSFRFRVMSYSFYVYIRFMLSYYFIRFMSYISVVIGPDLSISLLYRLFDDLRRFISFMVYLSPKPVYTPSCVK